MINTSRRSLITGLISLIAAPAIVRASSLMPVKALTLVEEAPTFVVINPLSYAYLCACTRKAFLPRLFVQLYDKFPQTNWE